MRQALMSCLTTKSMRQVMSQLIPTRMASLISIPTTLKWINSQTPDNLISSLNVVLWSEFEAILEMWIVSRAARNVPNRGHSDDP
ncbi:hypothetical protein LT40_07035 [Pseudomonas rhizosphaerae]|uniref:Uncharacterized protein n=1 Tax=Pseudomonas rhizosphaerae TaxID=216142 RepID=A0A089YTY0_9PSED|nr:hypothetical protein LT40_07035 [Pseudomonas rhizosphaerae]